MFQRSRESKILELLEHREHSTRELCDILDISISTLHRDLNKLEKEDKIIKSHGGVTIKIDTPFTNRLKENADKKIRIAKKALEFIRDGESIFLDNSTSSYYLAKQLSKSDFKNLLIISNSSIMPGLFNQSSIQFISTGGTYIPDFECFAGSITLDTIREFNVNKVFFSSSSISAETGLSDVPHELIIGDPKKGMIMGAQESICLVDSAKFEKLAPRRVFSLDEVSRVITDPGVSKKIIEDFKNTNTELIISG